MKSQKRPRCNTILHRKRKHSQNQQLARTILQNSISKKIQKQIQNNKRSEKIFKIRKNKMVRKCCITRRNQNRKEKHLDKIKRIRKRNQPTNNDTNSYKFRRIKIHHPTKFFT